MTIRHGEPETEPELTREQLLAIVERGGFKIGRSVAHLLLGPTRYDEWCLWCSECGRDSGFHYEECSKAKR